MEGEQKDKTKGNEEETSKSSPKFNFNSSTKRKKKISVKSKFDDPKLDPEWLYATLRKEINHEASYNLENDAKMRAVTQGTVDYEQFRQMVLGAHIKPLEQRDKVEGCQNGRRPNVIWNKTVTAPSNIKYSIDSENSTVVNVKERGEEEEQKLKLEESVFKPKKIINS